jgi:hypothetical protein
MAARALLLLFVAGWCAPAALAGYASPQHACCRRGAHHCGQSSDHAFRDARLHCGSCQPLVTAHQAPRVSAVTLGITAIDAHPFADDFSSAFSDRQAQRSQSPRAPPVPPLD